MNRDKPFFYLYRGISWRIFVRGYIIPPWYEREMHFPFRGNRGIDSSNTPHDVCKRMTRWILTYYLERSSAQTRKICQEHDSQVLWISYLHRMHQYGKRATNCTNQSNLCTGMPWHSMTDPDFPWSSISKFQAYFPHVAYNILCIPYHP